MGQSGTCASLNLYAYCDNNPIIKVDKDGKTPETIFDILSLGLSIAEVVANPTDPWAWAGLIGDVVDVAVPFVGGVGEVTKALKAASTIAENVDNVVDTAKAMGKIDDATDAIQKGWHVGDDITNLTKAGNVPSWSTVRQRFWKNEAFYRPELYPDDLSRLKKGLAPIGEDGFSMELHHPGGRNGDNFFIFEPLTQTLHRWIHYGE